MTSRAAGVGDATPFAASREQFDVLMGWLAGGDAAGLTHAELEDGLATDGRELLRLLLQDHLDLRAREEARAQEVVDVAGVARTTTEASHRQLATVFGQVTVGRLAYRRAGHANLHPADAVLNLPTERHSHGLRRLAATEACRGSFDDATDAIARATGTRLGKRQTEQLTPPGGGRLRHVLRHPAACGVRSRRCAGGLGGRQGHRDAPRTRSARPRPRPPPTLRPSRPPGNQGREGQPQAHGDHRCGLRHHHRGAPPATSSPAPTPTTTAGLPA